MAKVKGERKGVMYRKESKRRDGGRQDPGGGSGSGWHRRQVSSANARFGSGREGWALFHLRVVVIFG